MKVHLSLHNNISVTLVLSNPAHPPKRGHSPISSLERPGHLQACLQRFPTFKHAKNHSHVCLSSRSCVNNFFTPDHDHLASLRARSDRAQTARYWLCWDDKMSWLHKVKCDRGVPTPIQAKNPFNPKPMTPHTEAPTVKMTILIMLDICSFG